MNNNYKQNFWKSNYLVQLLTNDWGDIWKRSGTNIILVNIEETKFGDSLEIHNINMRVLYDKCLYHLCNMSRSVQNAVVSSPTRTESIHQYST
jgi:hypothetical protein